MYDDCIQTDDFKMRLSANVRFSDHCRINDNVQNKSSFKITLIIKNTHDLNLEISH